MNVKEAVARAKKYILDLNLDEQVTNIGLEEVELDSDLNAWAVTIGFSRPWDQPKNPLAALSAVLRRSYKVVRISNSSDEVIAVKHRECVTCNFT